MNIKIKHNPCRIILEKEVFAKFAEVGEIEHLRFKDDHYTDALVAPLRNAPGLWIVFMWIERPFNFSHDVGYLEIVSPEKCAKTPLNLVDPERQVHLYLRANQLPGYSPSPADNSGAQTVPMTPYIEGRMPKSLNSVQDSDDVVRKVYNFAMDRAREEQRKLMVVGAITQPVRIQPQTAGTPVVA